MNLRRSKDITEPVMMGALYKYQSALAEVTRYGQELTKAKSASLFHKWRVIEEGNVGVDCRVQIAEVLLQGLQAEVARLKEELEVAKTGQELAQGHFDHGRELFAKKELTKEELERRELLLKDATAQWQSLNEKLSVAKAAVAAFEDNQRKL